MQGNHDLNRGKGDSYPNMIETARKSYQTSNGEFDPFVLQNVEIMRKPYKELYEAIRGQSEPERWHYCEERNGYNIICLNTAIFSGMDKEDGELILGSNRIDDMFKEVNPKLPVIVLAHHDLEALHPRERQKFQNQLNSLSKRSRRSEKDKPPILYLCGHTHEARPRLDNGILTFFCGTQMNSDPKLGKPDMDVLVGVTAPESKQNYVQAYSWEYRVEAWIPDYVFSYQEIQDYALDGKWYFPERPPEKSLTENSSIRTVNAPISTWLHLSDLHVFQEADKNLILEDYDTLSKICTPSFLIVTGDFRHISKDKDYQKANAFLEEIMNKFGLSKAQVFLAPGNHDVNRSPSKDREAAIQDITSEMEGNKRHYNAYSEHMETLLSNFSDYDIFIKDFYRDSGIKADDERRIPCPLE